MRSPVRSRLSPPQKHRFYLESVFFSNFFRFSVLLGQRKSQQNQPFLPFVPSKGGQNGLHSGKVESEEDCFLQIQGLRGSGRQWQADFQVYDLVSPAELTPAKARKEVQKVAAIWEDEVRQS